MENREEDQFCLKYTISYTHRWLSFLIVMAIYFFSLKSAAQATQQFIASGTFTVPANITSIKVECTGAGGRGSTSTLGASGYGGGGGGAYASSTLAVVPGTSYNVIVGNGGSTSTINGGDSSFGTSIVIAKGGLGAPNNNVNGALGGTAASSVGDIKFSGGNGGNNSFSTLIFITTHYSGGGGGGGASTGSGNSAVGATAGAAKLVNGGKGGDGVSGIINNYDGLNGGNYGAGGSGAVRTGIFGTSVGGNGASGYVIISYQDLTCSAAGATTWSGTAWSNGVPSITKKAIINGDYNTVSKGSFTACSCTVNAGKTVTIGNGTSSDYIELQNELVNNGTVVVNNNAGLIQRNNINNSGNISVKRNAKPMKRYDFTYWSSPVSPQTLVNLSPGTLSDKFYSWNPDAQSWVIHYNGSDNMISGKGYIVRAPQSFPINVVNATDFVGTFTGVPNNGDVSLTIRGSLSAVATDYKWNLIGNPYPSAVNLSEFLTDNSTKVNGTVYFWTHNSPPSSAIPGDAIYNYTASDYAAYNLLGGTATAAATPDPLNPVTNPSPNANVPNGYLASGQSFFVRGKADTAIKFTNTMRENSGNNQFFRIATSTQNNASIDRFWINLRNNQGAFNQALVGYIEDATNEFDDQFDGELFGGNYVTIYSINVNKPLTIQGRALPFENSDTVNLGIKTTIAGTFSISLDNFEGLFLSQDIFLKDNLLNVIHDLKSGGYEFQTAIGTVEDRFEIVYQNASLGTTVPSINSSEILIYKKDKNIQVNAGKIQLETVKVFDIQGRLIHFDDHINDSEWVVKNLPDGNQVIIVQVKTSEGTILSKKIIF